MEQSLYHEEEEATIQLIFMVIFVLFLFCSALAVNCESCDCISNVDINVLFNVENSNKLFTLSLINTDNGQFNLSLANG